MAVGPALEVATSNDAVAYVGPRNRLRSFQVLTTARSDRGNDVLGAAGLPQLGTVHPEDPGTFVVDLIAREGEMISGSGAKWMVDALYSNEGLVRQITSLTSDPTVEPPIVRRAWTEVDEVVDKAYGVRDRELITQGLLDNIEDEEQAPTNSAEQLYRDTLTRKAIQETIVITRNENRDQTDPQQYAYTLNDAQITIAGKVYQEEELLMKIPVAEQLSRGTFDYDRMSYRIVVDKRFNHRARRFDVGNHQLQGGELVPIYNEEGTAVVERPLRLGVAIELPLQDAANRRGVVREFQVYEKADWSPLNLPT